MNYLKEFNRLWGSAKDIFSDSNDVDNLVNVIKASAERVTTRGVYYAERTVMKDAKDFMNWLPGTIEYDESYSKLDSSIDDLLALEQAEEEK